MLLRRECAVRAKSPHRFKTDSLPSPPNASRTIIENYNHLCDRYRGPCQYTNKYMGLRHNACLKVILEKVHSPVGENKIQKWSTMVRTTGGALQMLKIS